MSEVFTERVEDRRRSETKRGDNQTVRDYLVSRRSVRGATTYPTTDLPCFLFFMNNTRFSDIKKILLQTKSFVLRKGLRQEENTYRDFPLLFDNSFVEKPIHLLLYLPR